MPEDNYYPMAEEGGGEGNMAAPPENAESNAPEKEQEGEDKGVLAPKSLFAGKSPTVGQTITMKVSHIYEDEVLLSPTAETETEEPSMTADQEFEAMDQKD